ncbi:hypothetical protein ACFY1L_51550 [Streptomyces sp. NPDC001663]|uniref:hypothetical protein n=1 Tax=Streptomyces sp. NPDC001663 TaxID=3364597 RepID=UPI0036C27B30
MTGHEQRAGAGRASHAGACARAGLFAVLGTVLATFGHHAVAEVTVPWRQLAALIAVQFAAVWPLARRRYAPVATVMVTLAMQGLLHLALSCTDGDTSMGMPQHAGHMTAATEDGHAWHQAGAAMTTVHTAAALVVAWLLHRADVRMTAALGTLRTLARAASAVVAQVLPRSMADPDRALPRLPDGRTGGFFAGAAQAREGVLEHAVVRRGPPRREHLPILHRPRHVRGRILPYLQGVPLCPCPPTPWPVSAAV